MAGGDQDNNERTEEPTQTRREEFRRRGQVAQTKELSSVLFLFTGAIAMLILGKFFFLQFQQIFSESFGSFIAHASRQGDSMAAVRFVSFKMLLLILPVSAIFFIMSFLSSALQIGFLSNDEALSPDFERVNPVSGFKRIFSLKSLVEGIKATIKVVLVGIIAYLILREEMGTVPALIHFSIGQILSFTSDVTVRLLTGVGLFMALVAALDYFFIRWDLEKKMRMTKQELKEEIKSREGDPLIKARIRRIQREIASRRMMNNVKKADVVITNPTHISVALKYDATMPSPRLLAKGADLIALRIREIAKEHRIPLVENKPLARTIFKTMEIGQFIPRELYTAVAEVLSFVYKLKRKRLG